MKKEILNFGKMVAIATAVITASCSKDNNQSSENEVVTTSEPVFNVIYRVAGTGAISDWSFQPLKEADMKAGQVTFSKKGFNLPQDRTHQMFSADNGNTVYVYSSQSRLLTKYKTSGNEKLYTEVDKINVTPIIGSTFGNFRVLDEKNALVYTVVPNHLTKMVNGERTYSETVSTLKIGKINLETFTAELKDIKEITLPKVPSSPEMPNTYIAGIESPVLLNGKLYFGMRKVGYDPTKQGRAATVANENAYSAGTFIINYPSLDEASASTIAHSSGKGGSTYPHVFYAPSYVKTENNVIYHTTPLKGGIYKINNGAYDNSYTFDLKTVLGESSDVTISGIHYASNGIAYITYAPLTKLLEGGLAYKDGKAVWSVARVDLNAKTAIKMNVTSDLWLTFHQSARFVNGKLYMALCPMTGDGNIYIFDPTKADANGFEKGATLHSAGGAIYLGIL